MPLPPSNMLHSEPQFHTHNRNVIINSRNHINGSSSRHSTGSNLNNSPASGRMSGASVPSKSVPNTNGLNDIKTVVSSTRPTIRPMKAPAKKEITISATMGASGVKKSNAFQTSANGLLRPPLPQSKPHVNSIPGRLTLKGLPGAKKSQLETMKPLNPNYRPLENSFASKTMKPLEATLTVAKSNSSDSLGNESCVSLTISRSPSPFSNHSNLSSAMSNYSYDRKTQRSSSSASIPHRVFPQTYSGDDKDSISQSISRLEQSPVVFDANLSFFLGTTKQNVKQSFRPSPAHQDPETASSYLSCRIQDFLKRTDHVMEEWKRIGGKGADTDTISLIERQRERNREHQNSVGRSKSVANILVKGYQIFKSNNLPPTSRSRPSSVARDVSILSDSDTIVDDVEELSEMTCDLQEERSTSNMTTERLEAEVSERLKLEKELEDQQKKVKDLQDTTDKLEMELICAKSDLNGISEDEDGENENGENGGGVYKLKYERVARELEFTKRRLQTQHQHDLEQLVGLKKQLEKKLADAYEEVEEQRQVVSQWKRKTQKMTNEMNDLRLMLEEQNSRNNVLEKKQRKFDSECQSLRDASRQEKMAKERLVQEKEVLVAEKFTLEQNLADTKMELEIKEEKLISMQRELEELSFAGGTEEEVAQLKRTKLDFERKNKEQEEELDELAGQVQMLEQSKLRLEMTLETMRKEARREAQQRDDEMEEVRGSSYKKIKALECQLESEHEERTLLLREKHELERRLANLEEQDRADRANEEAINHKLRRDLRKYKALLKDSQTQLERLKADSPNKAVIRQIKNQLEDAETARSIAIKARQTAESELSTLQQMYEDSQRSRSDAEEKATKGARERIELQAQIEENEEEIAELMKKFTSTVKQLNQEQSANSDYEIKISELELERNSLKEQIAELSARIENVENMNDPAVSLSSKRLELRIKELESRLELELATKSRIEVQCNRNKETIEKLQQEIHGIQHKELQSQDALKKSQKSLREMREEFHVVSNREQENMTRRKDLEKRLETAESEAISLKNDLRLALQRIADLQQAMEEGDSDHSDSDINESSDNSLSDFDLRPSPMKNRLTGITKNGLDSNLMLKDGKGESRPRAKKVSNASMASSSSELSSNNPHIGDSSYA